MYKGHEATNYTKYPKFDSYNQHDNHDRNNANSCNNLPHGVGGDVTVIHDKYLPVALPHCVTLVIVSTDIRVLDLM